MRHPTRSRLIIIAAVVAVSVTALSMVLVGSAPAQPAGGGRSAARRRPLPSAERTSSASSTGLYPVAHLRRGFRYPVLDPSASADNAGTARAIDQAATTKTYIEMAKAIETTSAPPPPQASPAFPPIPTSRRTLSAGTYARHFVRELLDVNFATDSRSELLAWANLNVAPIPLVPIPQRLTPLYLTWLLRGGEGATAVPSAATWSQLAAEHVTWHASGIQTTTRSTWTSVLADGLDPPDARMDLLAVTGTLTVTQPGHPLLSERFSLHLDTGTAMYEPGYGVSSLDHWTLGR